MPAAVKLREDFSAEQLWALTRRSKDVNQGRRLLSLAAVRDGKDRGKAARIGEINRQTLRDWVHRFNAADPEGLFDNWTDGPNRACRRSSSPHRQDRRGGTGSRAGRRRALATRRPEARRRETFSIDFHRALYGALLETRLLQHRRNHASRADGEIVEAYKKTSKRR